MLFFRTLNFTDDILEVLGTDFLVLGKEGNHFLEGILEVIVHETRQELPLVIALGYEWRIDITLTIPLRLDIFLALQIVRNYSAPL